MGMMFNGVDYGVEPSSLPPEVMEKRFSDIDVSNAYEDGYEAGYKDAWFKARGVFLEQEEWSCD